MSLAQIIGEHHVSDIGRTEGDGDIYWRCVCGELRITALTQMQDHVYDHANHLADELTKAGYGNVQEAKAEALTEAAKDLAALPYAKPDAPERAHYERMLAIRRGNTDTWLKERAERIKENR